MFISAIQEKYYASKPPIKRVKYQISFNLILVCGFIYLLNNFYSLLKDSSAAKKKKDLILLQRNK